jgi:hypothetical protein
VTFSCSAKRKVTKEKAAPVLRAVRVPCAACLTSAAVELARCAQGRPRAQTVLAETPRSIELLGATQGPRLRRTVVRRAALNCKQIRRPGYVRTPVTFSCLAKRIVTKEKATPVSRALRVPCAACLISAAVELARCAQGRPRAQTVLADIPEVKRAARRDTGAPTS